MHGNLPAQAQRAIFSVLESPNEKKQPAKNSDNSEFSFKRLAMALFPKKTPAHLEYLTGEARGTWYDRLQNDREPPSSTLIRMLWTTEGGRVLGQAMRGCKAEWWRQHQVAEAHMAAHAAYEATFAAKQLELGL